MLLVRTPSDKIVEQLQFRIFHFFEVRRKGLEFEVELAGNCNLNCWGCNHFSPLIKDEYLSVEEFKNDCERLGILMNHKVKRMKLLGGEPLLNTNIEEMIFVARQNFKKGEIQIITNGILLKSMSEGFWNACRKNNIVINITKYPIAINYNEIIEMANKYHVKVYFSNNEGSKVQYKYAIDQRGDHDPMYAFKECEQHCYTLKHGKMYCCTFAPHMSRYKNAFGIENMEISEDDGIDIYKTSSEKEILDFLRHPIPACKYCDIETRKKQEPFPWKVSTCSVEEWTEIKE